MGSILTFIRQNKIKSVGLGFLVLVFLSRKRNQARLQQLAASKRELSYVHYFKDTQSRADLCVESAFLQLQNQVKQYSKIQKTLESLKEATLVASDQKALLWGKIRTQAFVQLIGLTCAISFLFLLLRVETNIVGHYILQTKLSTETPIFDITSPYLHENYSMTKYLQTEGLQSLLKLVAQKTKEVVQNLSLKMDFPVEEVMKVINQVKIHVQTELFTERKLSTFILPKEGKSRVLERQTAMVDQFFLSEAFDTQEKEPKELRIRDNVAVQLIHNEIRNRVESDIFRGLTQVCYQNSFVALEKAIVDLYQEKSLGSAKLVQVLPHVSQLSNVALMKNVLDSTSSIPVVEEFSRQVMNFEEN